MKIGLFTLDRPGYATIPLSNYLSKAHEVEELAYPCDKARVGKSLLLRLLKERPNIAQYDLVIAPELPFMLYAGLRKRPKTIYWMLDEPPIKFLGDLAKEWADEVWTLSLIHI